MRVTKDSDVESQHCTIEYYTLQPAPTQWVAVGRPRTDLAAAAGTRSLLVGTGASEDAAVVDLQARCPNGDPTSHAMVRLEHEERHL